MTVPHAWRQDAPVEWEGPATYRCELDLRGYAAPVLRFGGVSYRAEVSVDGVLVVTHEGIWDAFDVSLPPFDGVVVISVSVTKNGGLSYPVDRVLSGFLPFVFHTFGGIYREVWLGEADELPALQAEKSVSRAALVGNRLLWDGEPSFVRGLLHWGWYPELGHPNPSDMAIRREIAQAKSLGFNLVKFCLWVPSHRYLELLAEADMMAWIELPLWNPAPDALPPMIDEVRRIVAQYRSHSNVVAWTAGCELGRQVPHEVRRELFELLREETAAPLIKDNSGGSEMYGGDLREYGTFHDYHPYCDLPFYPVVLDSLLQNDRPILLGEFNDIDVHRDLPAIRGAFWASGDPTLNAQGSRWQYDLPRVMASDWTIESERNARLRESSRRKALFMRKMVHETVRARDEIRGYVVTGWRDTPISSAGFFDDFGVARFSPEECVTWNGPDCLFLRPARRPPWVNGGNRPGWHDPLNHFAGPIQFRVGLASEAGYDGPVRWTFGPWSGSGLTINLDDVPPGAYELRVETEQTANAWPVWVVPPLAEGEEQALRERLALVPPECLRAAPFWREAAYEFVGLDDFAEQWARWLPISGDQVMPLAALPAGAEVLVRRIDTRTYEESAVVAVVEGRLWTTARPEGGLGVQPYGLAANPAGVAFLRQFG